MEHNILFARIKYKAIKKWVKVSGQDITYEIVENSVRQYFNIPENEIIEYYDEYRYQINNDVLLDFIWFSPRGVTIEIKLINEDFYIPATFSSSISTASTDTASLSNSDIIDVDIISNKETDSFNVVCGKRPLNSSWNEQDYELNLRSCADGREILKEYEETQQLSTSSRKKLTNITVAMMIENYGKYPKKDIKLNYAKSIINIFQCYKEPGDKGYEIFFDPETRTGFLETRLRTINRGSSEKLKKIENNKNSVEKNAPVEISNTDFQESIDLLKNACVKTQQKEIFELMLHTYQHRKTISNILEYYPRFKDTPGLISQDFYIQYPKAGSLTLHFPPIIDKIYKIYKAEISKDVPEDWDIETNAIIALLCLLPPSARGRGGPKKESAISAIDKIIIYHPITLPLENCLVNKKTTQPFLLAVGPSKITIADYYLVIDDNILPCKSKTPLSAFDELFQCHFVFRTQYDIHLKSFWTFLQFEIFGIKDDERVSIFTPREREIRRKILCA